MRRVLAAALLAACSPGGEAWAALPRLVRARAPARAAFAPPALSAFPSLPAPAPAPAPRVEDVSAPRAEVPVVAAREQAAALQPGSRAPAPARQRAVYDGGEPEAGAPVDADFGAVSAAAPALLAAASPPSSAPRPRVARLRRLGAELTRAPYPMIWALLPAAGWIAQPLSQPWSDLSTWAMMGGLSAFLLPLALTRYTAALSWGFLPGLLAFVVLGGTPVWWALPVAVALLPPALTVGIMRHHRTIPRSLAREIRRAGGTRRLYSWNEHFRQLGLEEIKPEELARRLPAVEALLRGDPEIGPRAAKALLGVLDKAPPADMPRLARGLRALAEAEGVPETARDALREGLRERAEGLEAAESRARLAELAAPAPEEDEDAALLSRAEAAEAGPSLPDRVRRRAAAEAAAELRAARAAGDEGGAALARARLKALLEGPVEGSGLASHPVLPSPRTPLPVIWGAAAAAAVAWGALLLAGPPGWAGWFGIAASLLGAAAAWRVRREGVLSGLVFFLGAVCFELTRSGIERGDAAQHMVPLFLLFQAVAATLAVKMAYEPLQPGTYARARETARAAVAGRADRARLDRLRSWDQGVRARAAGEVRSLDSLNAGRLYARPLALLVREDPQYGVQAAAAEALLAHIDDPRVRGELSELQRLPLVANSYDPRRETLRERIQGELERWRAANAGTERAREALEALADAEAAPAPGRHQAILAEAEAYLVSGGDFSLPERARRAAIRETADELRESEESAPARAAVAEARLRALLDGPTGPDS